MLLASGTIYAQGYLLGFRRFGKEKLFFELFTDGEFILLAIILYLLTLAVQYLPV
ncbi:hypothetical protein [Methanoculleus sp. MH98A]|uniref:hypothetical protein n=1 Tax=Methanoculleus sp. MH98A TaxID=1495314 RepID=UPI000AE41646|nr:hypothetical protein [Methanoculleus sp. MH98A]